MFEHFGKYVPGGADVIQALQPKPNRLRARLSVPLASKKTAQARHQPNRFTETGRLRRRNRVLADETDQRLPLDRFKINRARHIRGFSSEFGEMKNPPGHHQVDRQTGFDAVRTAQLPSLNLAAALERAMEYFNTPAPRIPIELLAGLLEILHRQRRQEHPFHRLKASRGVDLPSPHYAQADVGQLGPGLRRPEFDRPNTHFHLRRPRGSMGA